ncbi:MAG: YicC family protein [Oscillospiraceae bacterium]|nr:YicC family protein [Oscillospiraceae bacterium]
MIKSMTGYGCASGLSGKLEISVELRSVNNRYLDCSVRIPRVYTALEDVIKSTVQERISRGKLDVFVTVDSSKCDDVVINVNEPLLNAYMDAIGRIGEVSGAPCELSAYSLSRLPDVLTVEKREQAADELRDDLTAILKEALEAFDNMRSAEGKRLFDDISGRLTAIEKHVEVIEIRSPQTVEEYRAKLTQKMQELLCSTTIDEARILTEAAIYADKVAVDEETVRLRSHIAQFRDILMLNEPVGRKLDFLVQEMNREANTISSKCGDTSMAHTVVDIKSEIEKIREQIQNIE